MPEQRLPDRKVSAVRLEDCSPQHSAGARKMSSTELPDLFGTYCSEHLHRLSVHLVIGAFNVLPETGASRVQE